MQLLGKLLVEHSVFRIVIYALVALILGVSSSFLTTEITDTSTNPPEIKLALAYQSFWLYSTLIFLLLNVLLSFSQQSALNDVQRYNDSEYRDAVIGKVAVELFAKKIPDMVEKGEIKTLEDALKLVKVS